MVRVTDTGSRHAGDSTVLKNMSKKTPDTEPTHHFHGAGWKAILEQAEHLEANPNATHVLLQVDLDTGVPTEPIILDNRADVLFAANLMRERAEELRNG